MRQLFTDLKALGLTVPGVKTVGMWNNQLDWFLGGKLQMFETPAIFFAFDTAAIIQLGEGRQLYDPLFVSAHILHWQMDAGDGTFDQNLDVFDFAEAVYLILNKFQPGIANPNNDDLAGAFIRVGETQDHQHAGVYHFKQMYKTTFIDDARLEPVGGIELINPTPGEIKLTVDGSADPDEPHIYDFNP